MDIRCESWTKFGEASPGATGEVRVLCRNKRCKIYGDEVVEHIFDLEKINENGVITPIDTKRLKRPK